MKEKVISWHILRRASASPSARRALPSRLNRRCRYSEAKLLTDDIDERPIIVLATQFFISIVSNNNQSAFSGSENVVSNVPPPRSNTK